MQEKITIQVLINAQVEKVWTLYTLPEHLMNWNNASVDWHTPKAENDLKTGGKFCFKMESKNKKEGFDFRGKYTKVKPYERIEYILADKREVKIKFAKKEKNTELTITFDSEDLNPIELQRNGWLAILNNFKKYVELKK